MKRAFTLVELLVVVAIIVVLLALLVPGLERAMNAAATARCAANLHGIGLAMHLDLQDHKSRYPQLPTYSGLLGNAAVNNPAEVRTRPLNAYLNYTTDGSKVPVGQCPSDRGDSFENPSLGGTPSHEKWGTSYLTPWFNDPICRTKATFGSSNTSVGVTVSPTQRSFTRTDNKLVMADWPWFGNRHYHLDPNQWHTSDPVDRRFNTLFADSHAELFYFDRDQIEDGLGGYGEDANMFTKKADESFKWW